MSERVCPWWMGSLLLNPLRRWMIRPEQLLAPYIHEAMTVLEPGPGAGFFTLPLASLVGPQGRIIAIDTQPKTLDKLRERAERAGLAPRIEIRLAAGDSLQIIDLIGSVDFALAFAVVHKMLSTERFFREVATALKPGASTLIVELSNHVRAEKFDAEVRAAEAAGLVVVGTPKISRSHAALLRKPVAA